MSPIAALVALLVWALIWWVLPIPFIIGVIGAIVILIAVIWPLRNRV